MNVRRNDMVAVISGNYRGKRGKVLRVLPKREWVVVEGINTVKRHTKPSQANPQGGIIEKEGPIHLSNVMVVCPKCDSPARVGKTWLEDGQKIRVCKKCGEMLTT